MDQLTQLLRRAQIESMTLGSPVQVLQPRNVRKRLGDGAILHLVADYRKGDTTITLMERYTLSKTAVLKVLRDNGVRLRRQPLTPEMVAGAVRLYSDGIPLARLAEQLDAPRETIRRALIDAGLVLRARGKQPVR